MRCACMQLTFSHHRNCLVAADLCVKVSDFGMSRDLQNQEYYRKDGQLMLPVRCVHRS